ncbi:MAG: 3'-5' exonuclease, partial [Evtepia sp.]
DSAARKEQLCSLDPARPWEVIAITFTNKAAGELKERLETQIGVEARDVWASTFHSACVRILRRDITRLGFPSSFTIYDTDDSMRIIKDCIKELNLDEKAFPPRSVLGYISRAKDELLLAADYRVRSAASGDFRLIQIAEVYLKYEQKLRSAGALDFDDIILQTVLLLKNFPEVREYYQNKFHYVLVDEYQDTNHLQYLLAQLLSGARKNFCVVGDDDQSIYRFRGATIENILSFEEEYKNARVIRLEQNYRSSGHILEAANAVIKNNNGRKGKKLWTEHELGAKIQLYSATNEQDEAQYVASQILKDYKEGLTWKEHAILYRMNAQSNQLEMALKSNSIPYHVIGGFRFFERSEVKDMLSYLCVIHNPTDDLRLLRIVNTPTRGIGARSLENAREISLKTGQPLWTILKRADEFPLLKKVSPRFRAFVTMIEEMQTLSQTMPLPEFYDTLLKNSGYQASLENKKTMDDRARLENVKELKSSITGYVANNAEPSLSGFLDEIALYTDLDGQSDQDNCVTMMTMHAAKGLEFPVVFMVGAEEGLFPSYRVIGEQEELEEERRLCYVAMTRAKSQLYVSCAAQRMLFGRTGSNLPSRFLEEIPEEYTQISGRNERTEYTAPWETKGAMDRPTKKRDPNEKAGWRAPTPKATSLPSFSKGDMVEHTAFGQGMVLSIQIMGGDALLEIAFDKIGTKRLMLKAAAQHMKKLSAGSH